MPVKNVINAITGRNAWLQTPTQFHIQFKNIFYKIFALKGKKILCFFVYNFKI